MPRRPDDSLASVAEASDVLGVSLSTVWRLIRRGAVPSLRQGGRRLIPRVELAKRVTRRQQRAVPPLTHDHPIFRLVGAGRGGGRRPGARDKHAILDS